VNYVLKGKKFESHLIVPSEKGKGSGGYLFCE